MVFFPVFLVQLVCSIIPCEVPNSVPSDPLNLRKRSGLDSEFQPNSSIVYLQHGGGVEGYLMRSILQRQFHAFEGIPYGESTGGERRFKAPIPKLPWKGIREAMAPGPHCAQVQSGRVTPVHGSEDCLYVNVYTPVLPTDSGFKQKLPVIINIHGGGFFIQAGNMFGPAYLLDEDVILVNFNYRLGVLGFLSTGDDASTGNWGLKDQALAIKWVHDNIEYFGGNKALVTLMGQSAGGASVHFHMIYSKPIERQYFSAGISGSGTAFNPWALLKPRYVSRINKRLGERTGCGSTRGHEFVECLRRIPALDLVREQPFLYDFPTLTFPSVLFGPVIEPVTNSKAFITESPEAVYKRNGVAKYPWILTQVEDEGHILSLILRTTRLFSPLARMNWKRLLPTLCDLNDSNLDIKQINELQSKITEFYFAGKPIKIENIHQIGNAFSDRQFNYPAYKALQLHSKVAPTYTSVFEYLGRTAASYRLQNFGIRHVIHADDEVYYFNVTTSTLRRIPGFKTNEKEYDIVKFLTGWVSNFARERNPTPPNSRINWTGTWEPWLDTPKRRNYLHINETISISSENPSERIRFWSKLIQTYML